MENYHNTYADKISKGRRGNEHPAGSQKQPLQEVSIYLSRMTGTLTARRPEACYISKTLIFPP
jgi:hypothetical protein